jgi:RHS repeat-associated protein
LNSSNAVVLKYSYDVWGNLLTAQNARNYSTSYGYDSNHVCATTKAVAIGTANQRTYTYPACDFHTSLPLGETDYDHGITRAYSYDAIGRPTTISESGGGIIRQKTSTYYDERRLRVDRSDLASTGDGSVATVSRYDQLGRPDLSQDVIGDFNIQTYYYTAPTQPCYVNNAPYSSAGYSFQLVSNAFADGYQTTTMGWTRTGYDQSGRPVDMVHFAGSPLPCPWGSNTSSTGLVYNEYGANYVKTTDEAGSARTSFVDGLGRMTEVQENGLSLPAGAAQPPCDANSGGVATTCYSYDVLDDLVSVTPPSGCGPNLNGPCNGRTFAYSSLKRLTSATNPESGTTAYTYDPNGNLHTRTAGGVTTTYTYDELDEITGKTYTDPTPPASYGYVKGWRTSASSGNTTYTYNVFDGLGRVTSATQTTNGTPYIFTGYSYNLLDGITSMTTPAGTKVTTRYDVMGRPNGVSATPAGASGPAQSAFVVARTSAGAIATLALGTALTEFTCYNDRQQPFSIRQRSSSLTVPACQQGMTADSNDVAYFGYTFPAGNNGNVSGQFILYGPSGGNPAKIFQQNYGYDLANRLTSVNENTGWQQSFGYDVVGNRWLSSGAKLDGTTPQANVFNANNQINATGYDARGNQTQDGAYAFVYDAENRLTSSTIGDPNPAAATYSYDADGRRVTRVVGTATTTYVYDVAGELAAEYTTGGTDPPPCAATCYLMTDHLGSTRMQTDAGGNQIALFDYAPFGEELGSLGGRDARWAGFAKGMHFTGKEQEGYEGAYMHYFDARYFSGGLGRFTSPDAPFNDQYPENPQSWNLYHYVRNNPLKYTDPSGEDCVYTSNQSDSSVTVTLERGDCTQKGGTYVNGTVNANSFTYNGSSLDFGFTDPNGAANVYSKPFAQPLSYGDQFINEMAKRADASNKMIAEFVAADLILAGAYTATYVPAAVASAYTTVRAAQLAAALKAAQEAWKRIPMEQRRPVMDWLSKIKPGAPPSGPPPPGASVEALQAYREIAVKIIQSGKDGVGTQVVRVDAIDKALGGR